VLFDVILNRDASPSELREHRVEIVHAIVDHHLLVERAEVLGVAGEDRPGERLTAARAQNGAAEVVQLEAEVLGVPRPQRVRAG
jgi:hypothetical protein